jgi:hypothetical protein
MGFGEGLQAWGGFGRVAYHYFDALLNCEALAEAIVDTGRLDINARLGDEFAEARGGWDVFFAGFESHCCFLEHCGGG